MSEIYSEYLEQFPEEYREKAEEVFKEWDANVTKKFEETKNEYKPYEELFNSYEPEALQAGLQVLEALRDNPKQVYEQIGKHYGYLDAPNSTPDSTSSSGTPDQKVDPNAEVYAKLNQYEQQLLELQTFIQTQQQEQTQQTELATFQEYLGALEQQYGEYDEDWVLSKIAAGMPPEDAVKSYHSFIEKVTGQKPNQTPHVLGAGGGLPYKAADYAKMSSKDTKDLVAKYLAQVQQEA